MAFNKYYGNQQPAESPEIRALREKISGEEANIENIFTQIGRLYYNRHRDDCEDCFNAMIGAVRQSKDNIDGYKKEILLLNGLVLCEHCGKEIPSNSLFCNFCGTRRSGAAPVDKLICKNCGETIEKGMRFCSFCGHKVEEDSAEPEAAAEPEVPAEPEVVVAPDIPEEPEVPVIHAEPEVPEVPEPPAEPEIPAEPVLPDDQYKTIMADVPASGGNNLHVFSEPEDNNIYSSSQSHTGALKRCPVCGHESNEEDIRFCEECGAKLVEVAPAQDKPAQRCCPNCGAVPEDDDASFCIKCGTRLK